MSLTVFHKTNTIYKVIQNIVGTILFTAFTFKVRYTANMLQFWVAYLGSWLSLPEITLNGETSKSNRTL